jgi:UDP-4-amino-4,6-dideoxy-N-acetyl-beta-L-altrosamine N-acetyltransferase
MIKSEHISLRPLKRDDWETTYAWRNDLPFNLQIMSHPFPVTIEQEKEWIEKVLLSTKDLYFGIEINDKQKLIGLIKLTSINWISGTCELGIYIKNENERGKGYGFESMNAILAYAFDQLKLRKITLYVIASNTAAIRLYEKCGFREEGHLVKQVFSNNEWHDVKIMSKINE